MAEDLRVDVSGVTGTGPDGIITQADVARAAAARVTAAPTEPPSAPPPPAAPSPAPSVAAPTDRTAGIRQAIAAAMSRSNREIPHYYLATDVDVGRALAWLARTNAERPIADRILPAALFLRAVALALREAPELNCHWTDGAFRPGAGIHPGVAVALRGGGLVAPALHDADGMSLDALMRALRDVVQRARTGMLRSSELTDATVTITNLGDLGVQAVFGVVFPPQVALVGIGTVIERPWAEQGMVGVRPVATVTLAADHRASDGLTGGRFLSAVARLLRAPEQL
jgi:pyruvate dehydrogenase E2 component (dihydrolipoamide acetyltransferase)